jgi:hypothetical protein
MITDNCPACLGALRAIDIGTRTTQSRSGVVTRWAGMVCPHCGFHLCITLSDDAAGRPLERRAAGSLCRQLIARIAQMQGRVLEAVA